MSQTFTFKRTPVRMGIPTLYKGVMMRSRTEARWGAFFDSVGWPWLYEPLELDGYIPDFVLTFETGPLLVEVKSTDEDIDLAKAKIEASGWDHEAIIVVSAATPELGAFLERDPLCFCWSDAAAFFCLSCGKVSIHSSDSWTCRVCGIGGQGNAHVGLADTAAPWLVACSRVQWRPA